MFVNVPTVFSIQRKELLVHKSIMITVKKKFQIINPGAEMAGKDLDHHHHRNSVQKGKRNYSREITGMPSVWFIFNVNRNP